MVTWTFQDKWILSFSILPRARYRSFPSLRSSRSQSGMPAAIYSGTTERERDRGIPAAIEELACGLGLTWGNFAADVCLQWSDINNSKPSKLSPSLQRSWGGRKREGNRAHPRIGMVEKEILWSWIGHVVGLSLIMRSDSSWYFCTSLSLQHQLLNISLDR